MLTQFSCNLKGKKVEQNIYLSVALSKIVLNSKFQGHIDNTTRIRVYKIPPFWLKLKPCLQIGGYHRMRKGGNYLTA